MQTVQKSVYDVVYLVECDNLYSVLSNEACYPDLMVWRNDQVWRMNQLSKPNTVLNSQVVFNTIAPYVANMTEEESKLFGPVLLQLIGLYGIYSIVLTKGVMEISTVVNGVPKVLLVTVMNMVE